MRFRIEHTTSYTYDQPVSEAFSELRLMPRTEARQRLIHYRTNVRPPVLLEGYVDYFGNSVETLSIPFRHDRVRATSLCEVETFPVSDPFRGIDMTVAEVAALCRHHSMDLYDYLHPSRRVVHSTAQAELSRRLLPPVASFAEAVMDLNRHIFENYAWSPGSTDIASTPDDLLRTRQGVCQDFSHLMIGLLRLAGIPARYVSGYIESAPDAPLVGSAASHAWVDVHCPNGHWIGLDPTNNIREGLHHIRIGHGRDYGDVPPFKGTYRGNAGQTLSVEVSVRRRMPEQEDR